MATQKKSGRGSNLTPEDRKKGGENSHSSKGSKSSHKLTASDRKKGGENSR
ncbi:MAG: hypothetical protein J0I93_04120 [Legionella sp.]|mgnify:CR=1 FL=1|nr:hypothetical protein [Legionella sp.]